MAKVVIGGKDDIVLLGTAILPSPSKGEGTYSELSQCRGYTEQTRVSTAYCQRADGRGGCRRQGYIPSKLDFVQNVDK